MPQFVDRVVLHVHAGDGGHGCASIHREKFVPLGGPDGGNGGHGGDVILEVSNQVHTLVDFHFHPHLKAGRGGNGAGDHRNGARGEDLVLPVPEGTVVTEPDGTVIADLMGIGTRFTIAEGGYGGLGNAALVSKARRAPGFALLGEPGEDKDVHLELKSIADVGLVGYPSAGKSSLISVISAAKPKIADYPFTTLTPNLGVVMVNHDAFTIADVPGLIPGASEGRGLGLDFLRHIERCAVIAHVVDPSALESDRNPVDDIRALENELAAYHSVADYDTGLGDLHERPRIIVLTKMDVPDAREMAELERESLDKFGWPIFEISSVAHEGLDDLRFELWNIVKKYRADHPAQDTTPAVLSPAPVDERRGKVSRKAGPSGTAEFTIQVDHGSDNDLGGFIVDGRKLDRWIHQTDFENDEAVGYLADRLARIGVEDALFDAGAQPGCDVTIGSITFEWEPTTSAGIDRTPDSRGSDRRLAQTHRPTAEERKRASQVRRGLIDEYDLGQEAKRDRWEG
ncbi:GTPase ObgE [Corynebacterium kroppenstedtii]|uniref:GTPase ObgE n=1 Tax=Corynebacterium sp. PCR 32 TaxID=3351342 RepID=UPI0030968998